jgi:hypothetical protein
MQIVIRHYPDRKKPCLVLEQGNQGIVLGTFRNAEMERLYTLALGGNNTIVMNYEKRTLDEILKEVQDADSD